MPSGSTTRSARAIVRRLRAINPAPASSTSVRATSAVTSHAIHRRSRPPEVGPRVPLVDTSATLARRVEGGRQPERRHGRQAGQGEERRHSAIHGELDPEGSPQRRDAQREQPGRQRREPEAEHARESREDGALGQQLPHDASPPRAERDPHADLARAAGGPREQQAGRVGPCNEENEHRRRQNRIQRRLMLRMEVLVETGTPAAAVPRSWLDAPPQADRDRVESRLRPGKAHTVGEATEGSKHPPVTLVHREAGGERQRLPQLGPERELEALGHHTDDGRRCVVDPDDAASTAATGAV